MFINQGTVKETEVITSDAVLCWESGEVICLKEVDRPFQTLLTDQG